MGELGILILHEKQQRNTEQRNERIQWACLSFRERVCRLPASTCVMIKDWGIAEREGVWESPGDCWPPLLQYSQGLIKLDCNFTRQGMVRVSGKLSSQFPSPKSVKVKSKLETKNLDWGWPYNPTFKSLWTMMLLFYDNVKII